VSEIHVLGGTKVVVRGNAAVMVDMMTVRTEVAVSDDATRTQFTASIP
jgi:hypothetical protein